MTLTTQQLIDYAQQAAGNWRLQEGYNTWDDSLPTHRRFSFTIARESSEYEYEKCNRRALKVANALETILSDARVHFSRCYHHVPNKPENIRYFKVVVELLNSSRSDNGPVS